MGRFLTPENFTGITDVDRLINEVETKVLLAVPALAVLRESDCPVPPHLDSYWTQVGVILTRIVTEWANQGYTGLRSATTGPFTKTWWLKAGRIDEADMAALRRIGQAVPGTASVGVGPVWSAPPVRSLGHLFGGRRARM